LEQSFRQWAAEINEACTTIAKNIINWGPINWAKGSSLRKRSCLVTGKNIVHNNLFRLSLGRNKIS